MQPPDVSLIVPVRDEAGNIGPLVAEIRTRLDAAGLAWELFVVDDGSSDGSWDEIMAAAQADGRVQPLRHDRGLGKSAALMNGFRRSRGAAVVMLDGDGQDDPAEIPRMVGMLQDGGAGLVNGWKTPRLDPWHKTLPSRVFNVLVSWVTGVRLHDHNCGLKALRGDVARALDLATDMHRFIPVLVALAGQRVVEVPVHHRPRVRGASKYGASRFFSGLVDLGRVAALQSSASREDPGGVSDEPRARLRRSVYGILAAVAIGAALGRIGAVASVDRIGLEKRLIDDESRRLAAAGSPVDEDAVRRRIQADKRLVRPFLSGNDRSRWLTVRALVERGTFAIEDVVVEPGWDTIDAVVHAGRDGRPHLYSSKPPLLAVIAAAPYWALHRLTGWTLGDHPFEMGRMLLVCYGLLPLAVAIAFACRLAEALGTTDWGRVWAAALAAGGTLLTTFAVTFTNHLPAAACTAVSCWLVYEARCRGSRSWRTFAAAGAAAALAACFELPAAAWLAAVLVLLARADAWRTLAAAVPAVAVVAAAAIGTNVAAHGTPLPPYAHRSAAAAATEADGESWNADNWYDYAIRLPNGKLLTSYWRAPRGIDRGEPSRRTYAWHVLVGHHGIFSLTPAWLLVPPGLALLAARRRFGGGGAADLGVAIAGVSIVVVAFYLMRPLADRNYGGMSSGFRWVFWLVPLWVPAVVPAADTCSRSRVGRGLCLVLLGLSAVSVAFPTWNPWTAPWLERWLTHAGWMASP